MLRVAFSSIFAIALLGVSRAADPAATEPFNGKDLQGWKFKDEKRSKWKVMQVVVNDKEPNVFSKPATLGDRYELVNALDPGEHGTDIFTTEKFGDIHLELEFMVPKGSNSGIYMMGEYEVQILDSYGKPDDKLTQGDLGALYSAAAPKKNAAKKPGEWQKFVIDFQAPKFDGGKKTANAKFVKVVLNDVVLHENVEMKQQTPGGLTGKEAATGPLMFQGDHGAVAFRNIKITPRK
jgi:3-keto-disaccharide hydrolase